LVRFPRGELSAGWSANPDQENQTRPRGESPALLPSIKPERSPNFQTAEPLPAALKDRSKEQLQADAKRF